MTSIAFHVSSNARSPEEAAHVLARWQSLRDTLTYPIHQEHADTGLAAMVLHHGRFRSTGIVSPAEASIVFAIAGSYWLTLDAECLATPGQALQHLFQSGSLQKGRKLYGNYSYVSYDAAARRVTAECGGFGVVPLYYMQHADGITIASDLKFFLPLHRPSLCNEGVAEFLAYGHLISNLTLLEGVQRLMPSDRLYFEAGRIRVESEPSVPFPRNTEPSLEVFEQLDSQFERAVRRYSCDIKSVSVALSGGLDSRTTLLAASRTGLDVAAWTAGEPHSLECSVAKMLCEAKGLPLLTHENDGCRMVDWFDRAVWYSEARCPPGHMHFFDAGFAGVIAAGGQLHGLLGDVVVGGDYDTAGDVPSDAVALQRFCAESMHPIVYWPDGSWERLGLTKWIAQRDTTERVAGHVWNRAQTDDAYSTFLWSRYHHRGCGFIIPALTSQITPWGDMMTPFIDPAFFTTCASISRTAIRDRHAQLTWAARRYPEITAVPRVKDGVLLSLQPNAAVGYESAIKRLRRILQFRYYVSRLTGGRINLSQRESYPSYGSWYRTCPSLRNYFASALLSEQSLSRGLWERAGIERLLHDLRVGRNVWDAAASVLMVEKFARLFVDQAAEDRIELRTSKP